MRVNALDARHARSENAPLKWVKMRAYNFFVNGLKFTIFCQTQERLLLINCYSDY